MTAFKVVIPARFGSTRLPAKALADIGGRPMIQWVVAAALRSSALEVVVATDDERVATAAATSARASVAMTRVDHVSGTDRIAEVAIARGWGDDEIIVNVQGDEPLLPPRLIDQVATLLAQDPQAAIATLSTPVLSVDELVDPNVVKVVAGAHYAALYFSRAPIPWNRDGAGQGLMSQTRMTGAQRHLGIYAYRVAALKTLSSMPPSSLETIEKLEQLRALQAGMRIVVMEAEVVPGVGVDTPHDLERVRALVAATAASRE